MDFSGANATLAAIQADPLLEDMDAAELETILTPEIAQQYLDENQHLLNAVIENFKMCRFAEAAKYQQLLQKNMLLLGRIANKQPEMAEVKLQLSQPPPATPLSIRFSQIFAPHATPPPPAPIGPQIPPSGNALFSSFRASAPPPPTPPPPKPATKASTRRQPPAIPTQPPAPAPDFDQFFNKMVQNLVEVQKLSPEVAQSVALKYLQDQAKQQNH